ncbi:hypothetical protein MC885_011553 [Smutsia gigantea]|nr:hypothetical protein MC885_011553 [Smutsia gigantea]
MTRPKRSRRPGAGGSENVGTRPEAGLAERLEWTLDDRTLGHAERWEPGVSTLACQEKLLDSALPF